MIRVCRTAALSAFVVAALNFLILSVLGQYDFRLGPVHLVATYLFKPLMYLNGAFLLWLALQAGRENKPAEMVDADLFRPGWFFWAVSLALILAVYATSLTVNLNFFDWTHRALTTGVTPWSFFLHKQTDGFYRPVGFVSLWLDNQIFGPVLWGYHVQSFVLQILNGYLVARLGFRLGLSSQEAKWAGIAFIVLPCAFEAVIWPGARFDLLAATFTVFALERVLAGSVWVSTAAYCLGVLSKEAAYAYPLLLAALFLLPRPLGLTLPAARWRKLLYAVTSATAALLLIRVAIYGDLGGYPNVQGTGTANFVFNSRTITSMFTKMPASLFLINTRAGLPLWLKLTL
ncbi:MAG: hypothetical protein JO061_00365, partial [Acidobacteriaceae bacterium]|nr:hypothetical protein [Acidobacteriaceae bacterium]